MPGVFAGIDKPVRGLAVSTCPVVLSCNPCVRAKLAKELLEAIHGRAGGITLQSEVEAIYGRGGGR